MYNQQGNSQSERAYYKQNKSCFHISDYNALETADWQALHLEYQTQWLKFDSWNCQPRCQ
jgi:hypothetical protein